MTSSILPPEVYRNFDNLYGTITTDDGHDHEIRATLLLADDGEVSLDATSDSINIFQRIPPIVERLTLSSDSGWDVECSSVALRSLNHQVSGAGQSVRMNALVANATATLGGVPDPATTTTYSVLCGGNKPFCGDIGAGQSVDASFLGRPAQLIGDRIASMDREIGYLREDAPAIQDEQQRSDVARISMLFSLAYNRIIGTPWRGSYDSNGRVQIRLYSTPRYEGTAATTLRIDLPGQISHFLKNGWRSWGTTCVDFDMGRLIHQYVITTNSNFLEISLALASIWLEALKYQFAKNVRRYPENSGGYFLKPDRKQFTFKELLDEVFEYFGLAPISDDFISTVRNPVIHTGTLVTPADASQRREYIFERMETLLLKALEFEELRWSRAEDAWGKWPWT